MVECRVKIVRTRFRFPLPVKIGVWRGRLGVYQLKNAFVNGSNTNAVGLFGESTAHAKLDVHLTVRANLFGCVNFNCQAVLFCIKFQRDGAERARRCIFRQRFYGTNQHRREIDIGCIVVLHRNFEARRALFQREHLVTQDFFAFNRQQQFAGERRVDMQHRRFPRLIGVLIKRYVKAVWSIHTPRHTGPLGDIKRHCSLRARGDVHNFYAMPPIG